MALTTIRVTDMPITRVLNIETSTNDAPLFDCVNDPDFFICYLVNVMSGNLLFVKLGQVIDL